jgi:flagellar hook-associated protein 3 FlgL
VIRSTIGANMQELDDLDSIGSANGESITKTLSGLQSLDYNEAVTKLSTQKTVLDAAQATFAKVATMSLFSYLT